MAWKCYNCSGDLSKDDLRVFKHSSMRSPWCVSCVEKENQRMLEEEQVPGTPALYRSLPRYLENGEAEEEL